MKILKLIIITTSIALISCNPKTFKDNINWPFTLPGDKNWPTESQFLELRKNINGKVSFRGESDYKPHTWNEITNVPKPAAIIQPMNAQDVIEAMKFAKKYKLRLSVQSTGHHQDKRNIYDNGIHLDMSSMNSKTIDLDKRTLTLGTGNNFSQIQQFVAEKSNKKLVAICGADPGVGIYGWSIGGGHGALTRQYGLGVDALLSVELVLSNYSIVTASNQQNQDLFRSLRGSGGNAFGVALSVTVKLFDDPGKVSTFGGLYLITNETVEMFGNWMINAPNQVGAYLIASSFNGNQVITIASFCFSNSSFCNFYLSKLQTSCIPIPELHITCKPELDKYSSFFDYFKNQNSERGGSTYISSTALNSLNIVKGLQDITTFISKNPNTGCTGSSVLGGISATIDEDRIQTSVSPDFRKSLIAVTCFTGFDSNTPKDYKSYQITVIDNLTQNIFEKYSSFVYWNEPQHNFPKDDWKERYWGGMDNYAKLLSVKEKYDPENFFSCYHCVGYSRIQNEDPTLCPDDKCTCSNTPFGQCATNSNSTHISLTDILIG